MIPVSFYSSAVGKNTSRYLCKADSDIILAAFNQLEAKKDENWTPKDAWPVCSKPPRKRKLKKDCE